MKIGRVIIVGVTLVLLALTTALAYEIDWQVISSGGTKGNSASYQLEGTVAQTATGSGNSANYALAEGYWTAFAGVGGDCKCGDADDNDIWNISDAVFLITYIFGSGDPPARPCLGDADGNEIVNISDAVYMISYIFGGGPEPGGCNPNQQW